MGGGERIRVKSGGVQHLWPWSREESNAKGCGGLVSCMGGEKEYDRVSVEEAHSVAMGGEESMQKKCGGLAFVAMVEKKSQCKVWRSSSICGHGRQKSQCKVWRL
jgi:hypothetical protein